jgi:hypothetical protein
MLALLPQRLFKKTLPQAGKPDLLARANYTRDRHNDSR